jgi:hypothetical protein
MTLLMASVPLVAAAVLVVQIGVSHLHPETIANAIPRGPFATLRFRSMEPPFPECSMDSSP